jgi:hypothetical protein
MKSWKSRIAKEWKVRSYLGDEGIIVWLRRLPDSIFDGITDEAQMKEPRVRG